MAEELDFVTRRRTGPFTLRLFKQVLDAVHDNDAILTLTVSTGEDERIFYFTRGALLFLAVGSSGGELLARKAVARGLLTQERASELTAQASSSTPLLQDILKNEDILSSEQITALVEETLEDSLLEVSLWEGALALADVTPGNPPPRIYDKEQPAIRLSLGMKALLKRVRPKIDESSTRILSRLGGSFRNRVKRSGAAASGDADETALLEVLKDAPRATGEVLVLAQRSGLPAFRAAQALVRLLDHEALELERVAQERGKEEELRIAGNIEGALDAFVNRLLARTHLAAIYERIEDNERAAAQHRFIAEEHLRANLVPEAVSSIKQAVKLVPTDVGAREFLVKVLQGANRIGEAAAECIDLGRTFLEVGLPGRACQAFEYALGLAPSLGLMRMLAGLLAKVGRTNDAIAQYEKIAEQARKAGDERSYVDANQRILELDPERKDVAAILRGASGYRSAVVQRALVAAVPAVLSLILIIWGAYEVVALSSFSEARTQAWAKVDARDYNLARSIVGDFQRSWTFSRATRSAAEELLSEIDREEHADAAQRCARAARDARKLEAANRIPEALDLFRLAAQSEDRSIKEPATAAAARCEERVRKGKDAADQARQLAQESKWQEAYRTLALAFPDAPWLLTSPDVKIPCRIETDPPGARVFVDGIPEDRKTPLVVERPPAPWKLGLQGGNRETVTRTVEAVPKWPIRILLPRRPSWRAKEVVPSGPALVAGKLALVCGSDRTLAAFSRDEGTLRWREPLGPFGESELPPAAIEGGLVAVRTAAGTVSARELASGKEVWSAEVEPAPLDAIDPRAGRPVAVPGGVLVRSGARVLLVLEAKDGSVRCRAKAGNDVIGAPCVASGTILCAHERSLEAWSAASGESLWKLRLDAPAATAPVLGPGGSVYVGLESGGLERVDPSGKMLSVSKQAFPGAISTPLDGDVFRIVVGTAAGEVLAFDADCKPIFRASVNPGEPTAWVKTAGRDLVIAGDAATLCTIDDHGAEQWRHPLEDGTAGVVDEARIYVGGRSGLEAFDR